MPRVSENQLTKLYYSIGEVAEMFDVNASLIRFWEKEFPQIQPKKNKKGNRLFTTGEILKIDRIYTLVKEEGHTLEGAKKALKSNRSKSVNSSHNNEDDLIKRLEKVREKLLALKPN